MEQLHNVAITAFDHCRADKSAQACVDAGQFVRLLHDTENNDNSSGRRARGATGNTALMAWNQFLVKVV